MQLGSYLLGPNDTEENGIYVGDARELSLGIPDESIDLTVTSPPYDNLRDYEGYTFGFEGIAEQLFRVTKRGGVVVWVVGDATIKGSETGASFRQTLKFMEIGFNLHDTMIYLKQGFRYPFPNRYHQVFEYMFVLTKGMLVTFNPIKDRKNIHTSRRRSEMKRERNGSKTYRKPYEAGSLGKRYNVWEYPSEGKCNFEDHPAIFPEALARDHIISWSNPGDIVFDPMCGSGTTLKMAMQSGRWWLGFDIAGAYVELARARIRNTQPPLFIPEMDSLHEE